jgi:isoleucyl-tRNA synthetase
LYLRETRNPSLPSIKEERMPEVPPVKDGQPKPLKSTLNLPSTAFPMKANLPINEPLRLKSWEQQDLYAQIRRARANS